MKILIIGNGGREHALAWKIRQSPLCDKIFVAPGNAGTSQVAENVPVAVNDFKALGDFCEKEAIDLVVVGPEMPLVNGIRNYFEGREGLSGLAVVGPGEEGARLEGSKDFSKQFMLRNGIPTAKARTFEAHEIDEALEYVGTCKPPIVLKADGLAAGKGVVISLSQSEARNELKAMLIDRKFGEASTKVLVEEFLNGIEVSVFVLTDGKDYVLLPEAKDYKRIGVDDTGLNTGGMGAVSPVPFANAAFMREVEERVVKPTITGLQSEGIPFKGFLFIGLMNMGGSPYVIEYNVRMGDPETQAVMPRIESDFLELLMAAARGNLANKALTVRDEKTVTVVMVAEGYPGAYRKGERIVGLNKAVDADEAWVFHAGTVQQNDVVLTDGGRVIAVTGMGNTIDQARQKAYAGIAGIQWPGSYFRSDIGKDLMKLT